MHTIIGQKNVVAKLCSYDISNMPSTILLLGEVGSGKTFLAKRLAANLQLDIVELSEKTTAEELITISQCPVTKIYLLDLTAVPEKAQNKFLKFIEEPPSTVKIILEATSEVGILATVLNRCVKFQLEPYSIDELKTFSWAPKDADPLLYKFYNTPGKLNNLGNANILTEHQKLCNHILSSFPVSPHRDYGNAMTLSLNFASKKDKPSKLDFYIFLDIFAYQAFETYKATKVEFCLNAYLIVTNFKQRLLNKVVQKEAAAINLLTLLWESAHDVSGA